MNFFLLYSNSSFSIMYFSIFVSYSVLRFPIQFSPHFARSLYALFFFLVLRTWSVPHSLFKLFQPLHYVVYACMESAFFLGTLIRPLTSCYNLDQMLSRLHGYHWGLSTFPAFHHFLPLISLYFCWCKSSNNFLRMVHERRIFLIFAYLETLLFAIRHLQ